MRIKWISFSAVTVLVISGMLGCGAGGDQNEIVARVAGVGSITKKDVDHWTRVEFILLHEDVPTRPVPRGVVPDPPSYANCVSYLRRKAQGGSASTQPSSALVAKCRQSERQIRTNTINKLIAWDWTIGRAQALGLKPSDTEVKQQLERVIKTHELYGPNFARYLKLSQQTMADIMLRSRVQLLEVEIAARAKRIFAELPRGLTESQKQIAYRNLAVRYLAVKSWVAKTSCRKGYVVSACTQYTGSEAPPGGEA